MMIFLDDHSSLLQRHFHQNSMYLYTHCAPLYLIPFEEDAFDFLIFWSTPVSKTEEIKKIESYDGLWRQHASQCSRLCQNLLCWAGLGRTSQQAISDGHRRILIFFFPHFGTYEQTKISKNQKHLLQNVLDIKEHSVQYQGQ